MPNSEHERERLNARIRTISGTSIARELKYHRKAINSREAILERGVDARPLPGAGRQRYVAADDIPLCHKFLDERNVEPCWLT